ncbi:MAG: sigma-70 family RNA polymerase sigma factor [Bacteroidia bacterium]
MPNPQNWVKNYGDYLFSIAIVKVNNRQLAEDIVQDTFLAAVNSISSFKGESSEKTWLTAILNNKIIDHYRKKDVLKNTESYLAETEQSFNDCFFDSSNESLGHWLSKSTPSAWISTTDDPITTTEFYRVLYDCIQKMPSKLIPVFMSKFLDEKKTEDICKDYEISSSNYWVIIHRSKLLMRTCLEKNWFKK